MSKEIKKDFLTTEIRQEVKGLILEYLNARIEEINIVEEPTDTSSFRIKGIPYGQMVDILEYEVGVEVDEEIDTNGWDADYWKKFTYKDVEFTLYGSGYYGNCSISLSNE